MVGEGERGCARGSTPLGNSCLFCVLGWHVDLPPQTRHSDLSPLLTDGLKWAWLVCWCNKPILH